VTTLLPLAWAALVLTSAWVIRPNPHPLVLGTGSGHIRCVPVPRTVVAAGAAWVLPLALVPPMVFGAWAMPIVRARRDARQRAEEIVRTLPEIVDLFHLAVTAGMTVPLAVDAVVRRAPPGPLVDDLRVALDEVDLGRRLGDALDDVPARAGEVTRPLVSALVASDRYGAPLGGALGRLASEVRADRRRRAEEQARKVPVKLLFPLVCCVLPAFGLLTLAPLIAGAVAALRL
jgi:tight adherence protein C